MFSQNCLLSMLFTVVVLCTTIPQDTVEAKDSFVRRAEVAKQEHEQSSTVGGQLTIGNRHRVMEQDTATMAPISGGANIFTYSLALIVTLIYHIFWLFVAVPYLLLFDPDGLSSDDDY